MPDAHRPNPAACLVVSLSSLLAACAVGPDYRPRSTSELSVPDTYGTAAAQAVDEAELQQWWNDFGDPLLGELVQLALAGNRDVAAAEARLRLARASLRGTRGTLWPGFGASIDGSSRELSNSGGGAVESWQAGFDAAWEVDVLGGQRRQVEASSADVGGARASLGDVQRSIAAEVAVNYIAARSAQARLQVARDSLGFQDETVQITIWRNQAGLVSSQDVEQATVLRAQTAAAVPQLRTSYLGAANRIAVLAGEPPGSITARLEAPQPIPLGPDIVAAGVPADLLRRRPDLVAAERAVAAEVARIGVAQADLYPAFSLGGTLGSTASSAGDLGSDVVRGVFGGITAPLFQGGQLRARVDGQRAAADAALAGYEGAVLVALEDVAGAMVAIAGANEREAQLTIAEEAATRSAILARARYRSGLIDFQTLLEAERSLLSSQEGRLSARADRATATVQLYKALGGGWTPGADLTARQ